MINVNIISKVEIPTISENVIANLIKAEILEKNPSLTIKDITFERKLNPQRIEANVEAVLTGSTPTPLVEPEVAPAVEGPKNDIPEPEMSNEEVGNTVADIFGE